MDILAHYHLIMLGLIVIASSLMLLKGMRYDLRNTIFPLMLAVLAFIGGLMAGEIVSPPEAQLIPGGENPGVVLLGMLIGGFTAYVLYRLIRPMIFRKPGQRLHTDATAPRR